MLTFITLPLLRCEKIFYAEVIQEDLDNGYKFLFLFSYIDTQKKIMHQSQLIGHCVKILPVYSENKIGIFFHFRINCLTKLVS
jgi:hypothetical protein